jgi:hypothetical protein
VVTKIKPLVRHSTIFGDYYTGLESLTKDEQVVLQKELKSYNMLWKEYTQTFGLFSWGETPNKEGFERWLCERRNKNDNVA